GLPPMRRETELAQVLERESFRLFDLRRGPLLRVRLVRLAGHDHVLTVVAHHIVTDGWSTGGLVGELGSLSAGAGRGDQTDLPTLTVQYAAFAAWQREWLSGSVLDERLDYWRRQLEGVAPLELPTDRPRPAVRTSAGAVYEFVVPAGVTTRLKERARKHDGTLFM